MKPFDQLHPIFAALLLALGTAACVRAEASPSNAAFDPSGPRDGAGTGDWSLFRGDRGLSGVAAGTLPSEPVLLWTAQAGGAIASSPVVAGGRVYFGSDDGKLHCVDAADGSPLWAAPTEDMIESPPLVLEDTVYVGSSDFFLYAFDARTGELRWKAETDDKILGGANWVRTEQGLLVVVGSYDTKLYGFDAKTGEERWSYATQNYVNGTPAVEGDRAIFGGCDAVLHVVSVVTGERLGAVELGSDCHVAGSIAFVGGRAYFGHYGNQFVCVDVEKGELVWHYDSPRFAFFSSPAVTPDRVVFGGRDKHLHCVNRETGELVWKFPTRRKVDGSPVVCGDAVVFGSGDGRLYVLALEDGEERWRYDIGKAILASPAVAHGRFYVGANDGRMYAFGAAEDRPREAPKGAGESGGR